MRNEFILELLDSRLNVFLQLVEQCPPDKRREIPNGFKNHLYWHVGHVLTVTEFHVFSLSNQPTFLPERYQSLFAWHEARGLAGRVAGVGRLDRAAESSSGQHPKDVEG